MRRAGLTEDEDITLNKLAVLANRSFVIKEIFQDPIFRKFANLIGIAPDRYPRFVDRLVEKELFEKGKDGYAWFKHELVQMCVEDRLHKDFTPIYEEYHKNAATFCENLLSSSGNQDG
ncbi:MAG: hypothetical protein M3Y53_05350 [Thermoproteota archaeon]|nr:hypothetical protein [Thermoproteota archaeon]